jgi:hypothetical protein
MGLTKYFGNNLVNKNGVPNRKRICPAAYGPVTEILKQQY